jgi:serine/threonine protein kinase
MTLQPEQVVDNRYKIVGLLAQGGMGAVYRGWDQRLRRPVALKEMVPQPGIGEKMLEELQQQFEYEAQVLATLSHPNLVRVTDYFTWEGNEYLVMDFIEGESLAGRIERTGPQSEEQVLLWARQLLDALAYCHGRGVIHRDIKPHNIVIASDGKPIMVDFGLVKLWDPDDPQTKTVMRGAGTPEYAPPEQYDIGLGHTDPRSDIYSLGATLYHSLTGRIPPTATQRMANPACFLPPRRIRTDLALGTESAVLKAMEVALHNRFQSAEEMARALEALPARPPTVRLDQASPPPPPSGPAVPRRAMRGNRRLWVGIAASGALCILISAAVLCAVWPRSTPTPTVSALAETAETATTVLSPTRSPTEEPPPTDTPLPVTAEPTVALPPGTLLFEDDFASAASGWEVGDYDGGSVGYRDGYYYVISARSGGAMWGLAYQDFTDVVVDVDATMVQGPTGNAGVYGVKCRVQPGGTGGDGYALLISSDGTYSIQRVVDGDYQTLLPWTPSPAIVPGNATNHLRAVCDGDRMALFANGEFLGSATDGTFRSGDISLVAVTFEGGATEAHFDDLVVTTPTDLPLPGTVLFEDDFSDPSTAWQVEDYGEAGRVGYGDGYYYVIGQQDGLMVWGAAPQSYSDVVVEVDATQISAPPNDNNGYGLLCRVQPGPVGDGYALLISGDGYYSIQLVVEGDYEPLVPWTRSLVINMGNATNHIHAVCSGSTLALVVNGRLLAEAEDTTYDSGRLSLVAGTFEAQPTEVRFDDLIVYSPLR